MRFTRLVAALSLAAALFAPATARAQAWARFDVPDSALVPAIRALGAGYEGAWDALLVAALRARAAGADSAARLESLARRVANAESLATGGRIGAAALRRMARWNPPQRALRVRAAMAESLGTDAHQARRPDDANAGFRAALAHYRALGEARREAWVLGSLGAVAYTRGDLAAADSLYREALAARVALDDPRLVGNALNTIGSTNLLLGRPAVAREFLRRARAVRERTGERAALGATLNYLGAACAALGEPDSAEVLYRAALDLTVAAGDSARVAEVLANQARLLRDGGRFEAATASLERGLANARARRDRANEALMLVTLGDVERLQGRFTDAAGHLAAAVALHEALGDPRRLMTTLNQAGLVWLQIEEGARARSPFERAAALADSIGDPVAAARSLDNLAIAMRLDGDGHGAARAARLALDHALAAGDSTLVHDAATTLGQLAGDAHDAEGMRGWFERVESAGRAGPAPARAGDLANLGLAALAANRTDEAAAFYRRALAIASDAGLRDQAWVALIGLGEVAERGGDPPGALACLRRAATIIDTMRTEQGAEAASITLLARRLFVFGALVHLLQQTHYASVGHGVQDDTLLREAFAWSERGRARALLDRLALAGTAVRPVGLAATQAVLDAKAREALLVFTVGDSSSGVWVVTADRWAHRVLPSRPGLRARAEVLRRALADPERAASPAALEASRAMYRLVVEPFERELRGVRRLIIVPDGPLTRVPFEALLAADPRGGRVAHGAWLTERFTISYEPSASALVARRSAAGPRPSPDVLVVSDPRFGGGPPVLAPLPQTAAEAAALRALAGDRVSVLAGAEATRARVLAAPALRGAAVLHFATHGTADETEPTRGGLWLAAPDSSAAPELLSVADVARLDLRADLVTLSACETGLGRLERGEGVLGLTRAFLAAGARSVVVSLWSVNDRSTATLMQVFYQRLLRAGVARDRALAEARRTLLAAPGTRSPFFWAPFVLVGDTGPLRRPE